MKILGLSGSLRAASFNTGLLRAAGDLLPDGAELIVHDYSDVPLFNADLMAESGAPEPAERLKQAIGGADAVLIATPEYNYGIPGPLKNAIDWASRPAYRSVFAGKPVAIFGASPGATGTARAQGQLKQVLLGMVAEVFPYPEVLVGSASSRLEGDTITDEQTRELVQKFLGAFVDWARVRAAD